MKQSGLSDYIIAILELFEAEARAFKRESVSLAFSIGFILLGIGVLFIAFGFLLWAIYVALSASFGASIGALLSAGVALLLSVGIFLVVSWQSR